MIKKVLLLFLTLICFTSSFAGGGWTNTKNTGYFKLSEWWLIADQHYTDQGKVDPNVTTGIFNTSIYGEYGFTDRLTGIVYFPFYSRAFVNNLVSNTTKEIITKGDAINGIGDADISLKYGFTKDKKIAVAGRLTLGIPSGNSLGGTGKNLQTGDGEFNQLVQIDAGMPLSLFSKVSSYSNVYMGFNNRTNNFSDEFRYGAEFGLGFRNNTIWINAKLNSVKSFFNGALASEVMSNSIFANNTEYNSIAFGTAVYITPKIGLSAEYATATSGKIILARPSYSIGIFYDMK